MEIRIPEKFAKVKEPFFYYLSAADGDIKRIKEPIEKLDSNIKIANNPLVNYKYDLFKNSTHYTEVLHSIPNALYQIFEVYKPINSAEYKDKIAVLKSGYSDYLENKYNVMSTVFGVQIPVRMNDFKLIENLILKNKLIIFSAFKTSEPWSWSCARSSGTSARYIAWSITNIPP